MTSRTCQTALHDATEPKPYHSGSSNTTTEHVLAEVCAKFQERIRF